MGMEYHTHGPSGADAPGMSIYRAYDERTNTLAARSACLSDGTRGWAMTTVIE